MKTPFTCSRGMASILRWSTWDFLRRNPSWNFEGYYVKKLVVCCSDGSDGEADEDAIVSASKKWRFFNRRCGREE